MACVEDCAGVPGGGAVVDGCGTCVGGSTGLAVCPDACESARLRETGARYYSLRDFFREHAERYVLEPEDASPFGEILRAGEGLTWLHFEDTFALEPGRWVVDFRVDPAAKDTRFTLGVDSPSGCGPEGSIEWRSLAEPGWQTTGRLVFILNETCTTRLLLGNYLQLKTGWRLDWMRLRRGCVADTECVTVPGGEHGICVEGVCDYEAICPSE